LLPNILLIAMLSNRIQFLTFVGETKFHIHISENVFLVLSIVIFMTAFRRQEKKHYKPNRITYSQYFIYSQSPLIQLLYFTSYYHSIIFELCHILRNLFYCRKKQSI
jgi:hypothetical protein